MVDGALVEDRLDPGTWAPRGRTTFPAGTRTGFGPDHGAPRSSATAEPGRRPAFTPTPRPACPCGSGSTRWERPDDPPVDQLLNEARARLHRVGPHQAAAMAGRGGLLVDIRPAAQRAEEGEIPGALIIERNVLEWRLDPASPHRIAEVHGHDQPVVILCSQGYTSSLAAAVLQDLGLRQATDLIGGYQAWARAGLPVRRPGSVPVARSPS